MPCYLGKIMDEIKKLYELDKEGPKPYTDAQNILYEYACFLYKKDKPTPEYLCWVKISKLAEKEATYLDGWLKQIYNAFIKEFPEITREHILKLLHNPKDEDVAHELLAVAPFELLEEFYIKIQNPPPPPPLPTPPFSLPPQLFQPTHIPTFAPPPSPTNALAAPSATYYIPNLILSTQKKAPPENIITDHNIPINNYNNYINK